MMGQLVKMLGYKRAHGTRGEELFVKKFIMPYTPKVYKDNRGSVLAYVVEVRGEGGEVPPVLWSCHVDTVHRLPTNETDYQQQVEYDPDCGMMYKKDDLPLGADDGAGVWLLLQMVDAKVPGAYIFHRGEECGGIGSNGMADYHEAFLKRFKYAIAFDRRGTQDIITHQAGGRCASDSFAQAFADKLSKSQRLHYKPCNTGVFTDTANYTHIIPECTNVSVGYENEHTKHELLDVWHLLALRDELVANFGTGISLPVERDPKVISDIAFYSTRYTGPIDFDIQSEPYDAETLVTMGYREVRSWVERADPADVAELLLVLAENEVFSKRWEEVDE